MGPNLWEEQLILITANDEEIARRKAAEIGNARNQEYVAANGVVVKWVFDRIERVHIIEAMELTEGTEVFSRFLRESEVKSLLTPFENRNL